MWVPDFVISRMIWSLSMAWRDESWLSLTPEPERLLPPARAAIRAGRRPAPDTLVAQERALAERLVLRARRDAWERGCARRSRSPPDADDEETSTLCARGRCQPRRARPRAAGPRALEQRDDDHAGDGHDVRGGRRARPPLRRRGAHPPRGGRGGRRRAAARRGGRGDPRGRPRGRAQRRAPCPRARRPGLVAPDVGAGRGAARPLDERALVAHPERLQRVGGRDATSRSTAGCGRSCAARARTPTR